MTTWVFVGDSVTAAGRDRSRDDDLGRGWVAEVAARLRRVDPGCRVVNLGVPGDRAADVRDRVVEDMTAAGALGEDVVLTLAVGINDVRRAHLDAEPFDIRRFARAYGSVVPRVTTAVSAPRLPLLLVEPVLAPTGPGQREWEADLDEVCHHIGHLAAADRDATLVRVRRTFAEAVSEEVTRDGIHPTRAGHRLVADAWWRAATGVPGLLPEDAEELLAAAAPRWWDRLRARLVGG